MPNHNYGLISDTDARTIERTLDLIMSSTSPSETIQTCEVGIYSGRTSKGICDYIKERGREMVHTGIDNGKDNEAMIHFPKEARFIQGNSTEVYNKIGNESKHFILIDGNHSFPSVVADFFCYAPKVMKGGYLAFHDTGRHIKPFKDYQRMGDTDDPDMYISVRKALEAIGLFEDAGYDLFMDGAVSARYLGGHGFRLIFDEADKTNDAGGICVFKKK